MEQAKTVEWETPQKLFDDLNKQFNFTVDVAASDTNFKVKKYYTEQIDGLSQSWKDEIVWCNPPYGKQIADWVKKASDEVVNNCTTVLLIPARTDVKWFHEYVYNKAEIIFIKGRLKFGNSNTAAPFPNMLVIFRGNKNNINSGS